MVVYDWSGATKADGYVNGTTLTVLICPLCSESHDFDAPPAEWDSRTVKAPCTPRKWLRVIVRERQQNDN